MIIFWDILDEDSSHFSKNLEQQIQQDEQKLEKNKGILQEFRAQSNEKVHTAPSFGLTSFSHLLSRLRRKS